MSTQTQPSGALNHGDLIRAVATESGVSQATVKAVLRATFNVIGRTVAGGHRVTVTNFGTWSRRAISSTRNPQTGQPAGPTATAVFRPTGRLSEWVRSGTPSGTLRKLSNQGGSRD
jgi:nucleoid DNA-binding protein